MPSSKKALIKFANFDVLLFNKFACEWFALKNVCAQERKNFELHSRVKVHFWPFSSVDIKTNFLLLCSFVLQLNEAQIFQYLAGMMIIV